jgi:alpha-L-fucosidase
MHKTSFSITAVFLAAAITSCTQKQKNKITVKYTQNWESIKKHSTPEWIQDAKFGIFIHWGVYSVPAFGSEWYGRQMYMDTATFSAQLDKEGTPGPNKIYTHHKEKYGNPKKYGYKDFIPMFTAEKFNAKEWIDLFREAGAKYIVPVAEHHDGFAMYNSKFTPYNAVNMGPKRDVLKELFDEGRKQNLKMGASSHLAFNWSFFNKKAHFDTENPADSLLYSTKGRDLRQPTSEAFKQRWWNRTKDIIDNYQPDVLWFDFCIDNAAYKTYHAKLAAYYYNKGEEWKKGVVLQDKNFRYQAFPPGTIMPDLERGKMASIKEIPWQTDNSIGKNSWGYVTNWQSKDANTLVDDLVDIISKNGCLLLNIGPRADGTIPQDQRDTLMKMGNWLKINGEAVYGTRYWKTFGEGPTVVPEGYMGDYKKNEVFTAADIRFTRKGDVLYAIGLDWPSSSKIFIIKSLAKGNTLAASTVKDVAFVGSVQPVKWQQKVDGLYITVTEKPTDYAHVFKITFAGKL